MEKGRKAFGKDKLEETFKHLGKSLKHPVKAYLLGGGAMCFRDQKIATKDLDLVFNSQNDFNEFELALKTCGYAESALLEKAYEDMKASGIWQNKEGFRFDLFVKIVCNAISLSQGMLKRSAPLAKYGKLDIWMVSNEDIILFKGITERLDDANDIEAIIQRANIDWNIIFQECTNQSKARAWYGPLYDKLAEMEKRNIRIPILGQLLKLDNMAIVREAFEEQIRKGMSRKQARAALIGKDFTKEEIDEATGSD
ncbi:hypothetical protein COU37_00130 [Candidatus Micrarchaeota archaeon CG10_big_fil_rev_8_21_14_0_10_45_29]|nr:MAG: hypothetical protein COU37_00130 [Candidatus Micrarchaeota archaeon CG10_big_fil_rev_8_21_14_0_10_45_29]